MGKGTVSAVCFNCDRATPVLTHYSGIVNFISSEFIFKIMIRIPGKNLKTFNKIVLFFGVLGAVFYPIFIDPFIDPHKYREFQEETRKNIRREDIQPGNMNVWRNPFLKDPKKEDEKQ